MASTSKQEYEDLLREHGEDQLLIQAVEESIRFYEEVEVPRNSSETRNDCGESICSKETDIRSKEDSKPEKLGRVSENRLSGIDENGFDRFSGRNWIYPTNYPIRDYQFNIVQCALFKNTLVSLPTGLGKTFIAAVVMYNFYRWYPEGKVLFMAPTKPLVAQQIDSCYKVMGIPKHDTAEMTGHMAPHQRESQWKKCRLFFLTPQTLVSDLMRNTCPVKQIRCIVMDEAHRATGNYAYCQVIQAILPFNKFFRVLALSATPGNDMDAVQQVIQNLLIEHVEVRDESSADTAQYTNERIVETIVVKLEGFHKYLFDSYVHILGGYMELLSKWKLIYTNPRNTSKYSLIMARNKFRSNRPPGMTQNIVNQVESDFALCMTLAYGMELLSQQGLRNLCRFLKSLLEDKDGSNPVCRARLSNNKKFTDLYTILGERLGETELSEPDVNTSIGAIQTQSAPKEYSHPKMEKLRDVIVSHFQQYQSRGEETRVMVFCQYRDTVVEVCHLLAPLKPLIKVMSFVGQSAGKLNKGLSQKQQLLIMEKFRKGGYNTLISTSIGEEGLDIGEVDLIVCYDAHASPIRLVQRMGRTGRKRQGRIVMLLTEGKENKKYHQSLNNKKTMNTGLVNSKQFLKFSYCSPRMVPGDLKPECYKMFMSVPKPSRNADMRKLLMSKRSGSSKNIGILDSEFIDADFPNEVLPETHYLHSMEPGVLLRWTRDTSKIDISSNTDWLLNDNEIFKVSRSSVANDFQELLEFAARRRCEVPLSQTASIASQVCRSDLWPDKKRKKTSMLHSKGPQRKKRSQKSSLPEPSETKVNIKQRRLTTLWTAVADTQDDFVIDDKELMPPPVGIPHKKKKHCPFEVVAEGDDLTEDTDIIVDYVEDELTPFQNLDLIKDIFDKNLVLNEKIISKIKDLEDGLITCCRFSQFFHNSDLSSFLFDPVGKKRSEKKQTLLHLPDSGYFDELLNPEVWENCNIKEKSDSLLVCESNGAEIENRYITDECFSNQFLILNRNNSLSSLEVKSDKNTVCFNKILEENITSKITKLHRDIDPYTEVEDCNPTLSKRKFDDDCFILENQFLNVQKNKNNSLSSKDMFKTSFYHGSNKYDSHKTSKYIEDEELNFRSSSSMISNSICNSVLSLKMEDRNTFLERCNGGTDHISLLSKGNFDLGITQLLSMSPEEGVVVGKHSVISTLVNLPFNENEQNHLLHDTTNDSTQGDKCNTQNVSLSTSGESKKQCTVWEGCELPKPKDSHFNVSSSDCAAQPNVSESGKLKNGIGNLSQFADDDLLNWLETCKDGVDKPESPKNLEDFGQNISDTPPSPIISSQRKKSIVCNISSSTPKTDKIWIPTKRKKAKIMNMSSDGSTSKAVPNEESDEVFQMNSSLDDFEMPNIIKSKISSNTIKKEKSKKITKKTSCIPRLGAAFIYDEAEESREDGCNSSDGEDTSGLDELDESFVDDEIIAQNSVDIQAQYLQSVRSPIHGQGQFKIKEVEKFQGNIYSQALTEEEMNEDYEQDSFCVSGSDDSSDNDKDAQDTLDIIEAVLQKKKKKRRRSSPETSVLKKVRKRIHVASSSSDEENDVLKNLPFTQILKDSHIEKTTGNQQDLGGKNKQSSFKENYTVNKASGVSDCNIANNDFPADVWDDDDCVLLDDNFDDLINNKPSNVSMENNGMDQPLKKNKIINIGNEKEKCFSASESTNKNVSKNEVQYGGPRKKLKFFNNSNKKTLMTHFFNHSDKARKDVDSSTSRGETSIPSASKIFGGTKINENDYSELVVDLERHRKNVPNSKRKLAVLVSTRQVSVAPEIITALKSRHNMNVLVHSIQNAHYIVSPQIGVIRITFKDFCCGTKSVPLMDTAKNLTDHFQKAFLIVEHSPPSNSNQRDLWPVHSIDLGTRLQTVGIHILYSDCKASTADLLANLCCREFSCGHSIMLPSTIRDHTTVIQFLETLPGINMALAFNICCRFQTVIDFIKSCKTIPDIRKNLGVNREIARKLYFLLHDTLDIL